MSEVRWQKALDAYHEQHEEILTDGDARSCGDVYHRRERRENRRTCGTCTRSLPTRMATTTLASWAMSIWMPRKTAARSSSPTTASALSKTCSKTSRMQPSETKRGRRQHRQRPRFLHYTLSPTRHPRPHTNRPRRAHRPCPLRSLACLVEGRLHGLVAPGELADGKLISLVIGQAQIVLGAAAATSSLVFCKLA